MFGGGDDAIVTHEILANLTLQTLGQAAAVCGNYFRGFRETLIGTAPAIITRHRDGRRKGPLNSGYQDFLCCCVANLFHEVRVICCPQTNIVRKNRSAKDIIMTVNGVYTPHGRDRNPVLSRVHRGVIHGVGKRQPFGRCSVLVATGRGIATT